MDLDRPIDEFGIWAPEYTDGNTEAVPEEQSTPPEAPETRPKSFVPKCDLVKMGAASVIAEGDHVLAVAFRWMKKQSSYDQVAFFDDYLVRYGPWRKGEGIISGTERYLRHEKRPGDTEEMLILGVPPDSDFGIQICAVLSTEDDNMIDWSQAWTGAMSISSYESYDESHMTSRAVEVTQDSTPVFIPPRRPIDPRCDLVELINVKTAEVDQESETLTVELLWVKKASSYNKTGPIDHYLVRHGPVSIMDDVKETEARYLVTDDDSPQFTLLGVPLSGQYAVSICAMPTEDMGIDQSIDWINQPRPVLLEFDMDQNNDGLNSVPPPGAPDSNDDSDSDNAIGPLVQSPVVITGVRMGSDYGIVLVVLAVVGIITTIVACVWLFLSRKRRNAKEKGLIEP